MELVPFVVETKKPLGVQPPVRFELCSSVPPTGGVGQETITSSPKCVTVRNGAPMTGNTETKLQKNAAHNADKKLSKNAHELLAARMPPSEGHPMISAAIECRGETPCDKVVESTSPLR